MLNLKQDFQSPHTKKSDEEDVQFIEEFFLNHCNIFSGILQFEGDDLFNY